MCMNLNLIILGENDAFLRGREATVEGKPLDTQKTTTHIVPEKFREDVAALSKYIGEERFQKGLSIEVSLAEYLTSLQEQEEEPMPMTRLLNI